MHPGNNLTRDEAARRPQLIQTPLYDISLDLSRDSDTFTCEATIHFLCREPAANSFIDFFAPSVDSCELNGEEVPKEAFNGARITLNNLRDANELHVLGTCEYQNIGAGLSRFKDPVDHKIYLHSQFETFDAHRMFPCFDQPDLKASFSFTVIAPDEWVVVSNNPGQAQTVAGKENIKRWTFGATPKMSTYLTAIVAGPYHGVRDRHGDVDLGIFCRQSLAQYLDPDEIFTVTKQGLDFYAEAYKCPYPFQKYDQLFVPEFSAGAMENIGWVTFANQYKAGARRQDQLPTTHPIAADVPDIESVYLNFDAITYNKGACVLRQLVAYVTQDTFLRGVQRYIKQRQYSNASLADFLSDIEAGSGRDLKAWSKLWLETAGLNTLRPLPTSQSETIGSLTIRQEAPPEFPTIRPHRLAVGLYDRKSGALQLRRRVELDVAGEDTRVKDFDGERLADLTLVNDLDLTYAKIRLDERSLSTATEHLAELSDPLARAITWAALWDMLRDAEIPARRYLPLILKNIHGETDIGVVQDLLAQAVSAIFVYGDPANQDAALKTMADHALRALDNAPAGSDFQLAWAHAFINAARSPDHLSVVRGLLDGIKVFTGLKVDTDLRWGIVSALAGVGQDDGLIDAELKRDPTDEGQRYAAAARAARPTPEAKEQVWASLTEDLTLPLATMRSMIRGFHRFDQRRVLEAYAARYFQALANVWKERDIEIGLAFARMMFPTVVVGDATVEATDGYLAGENIPGPVRRVLLEAKDNMERAMRGRAADAATVENVSTPR